jgi:hypothetical protein
VPQFLLFYRLLDNPVDLSSSALKLPPQVTNRANDFAGPGDLGD